MPFFHNSTISFKLALSLFTITVISLVVALSAFTLSEPIVSHLFFKKTLDHQAQTIGQQLTPYLSEPKILSEQGRQTFESLLKTSTFNYNLWSIAVYDAQDQLLYSHIKQISDSDLSGFNTVNFVDVSKTLVFQGKALGSVRLVKPVSTSPYLFWSFLIALVLLAICASIFSWWVLKQISNPLIKLEKLAMLVVSTNNYQLRADCSSDDEIGRLARAFNRMLMQIEQRDAMLEKKVNRRTKELQDLAEDLRYQALHDSLTGLPNRALLNEEFVRAVAHADRVAKHFAVLLLDLDDFKRVNDEHGHAVGDDLLVQIANRIRGTLRGEDRVFRLGGDEFVVLLEGVEKHSDITQVANNLLKTLNANYDVQDISLQVAASIGGSIYPRHGIDLLDLKNNADIAMYRAKAKGKGCFMMFNDTMDETLQKEFSLHASEA